MAEFSVVKVHPFRDALLALHFDTCHAIIAQAALDYVHARQAASLPVVWYTDGSCQHPRSFTCRYGAYAIVLDLATTDAQRCHAVFTQGRFHDNLPTFACVGAARTQGEQDILRAELLAGACVLLQGRYGDLFMDSTSALRLLRLALQVPRWQLLATHEHCDVLIDVWEQRHSISVKLHHVRAHEEHNLQLPPVERYRSWGNAYADSRAKQTAESFLPGFAQTLEDFYQDHVLQQDMLEMVLNLHFALQPVRAQAAVAQAVETPHQRTAQDILTAFSQWQLDASRTFPAPETMPFQQRCSWGLPSARAMLQWLSRIQWPLEPGQGPLGQDTGTTWVELFLSFAIDQQQLVPVIRQADSGEAKVVQLGSHAAAVEYQTTVSEQAQNLRLLLDNVQALQVDRLWPGSARRKVEALYLQGHSGFVQGICCRPVLPGQLQVATLLQEHFRQSKSLDWLPVLPLMDRPTVILEDSWTVRTKKAKNAMYHVRKLRP
eukprot:Skav236794  [mRNA]  locus=scaffold1361:450447:451916:- [translate_table: standard]